MTETQAAAVQAHRELAKTLRFGRQNVIVLTAQLAAWIALLCLLHEDTSAWLKAVVILVFCIVMQGVFSLMHECFHGHGHRNALVNRMMGVLASTVFGTSYTLFRINHLGHHARNRTRAELVDYIYPDESPMRKIALYYTGICGGIWISGLIGAIVLPLLPYGVASTLAARSEDNTYLTAFRDFSAQDWRRMRIELALGAAIWTAAIIVFDWHWLVLVTAYAAFAFSWSWLQWVYHVRAPIDVVEGAYNLRLSAPIRWLFLNFNYNLTHHRDSSWHWQELHTATNLEETQPLWHRLIRMILPPQRLPADPETITKTYF